MTTGPGKVAAWDGPTRLFKWALVLLVVDAWLSNRYGHDTPRWHVFNGYGVLILIVFRLLWGIFGGATARFSTWVTWPWRALVHLARSFTGRARRYLGHNPAGGWMVLALMAACLAQAALGLFTSDEDRVVIEGPLAKTVSDAAITRASDWHAFGFNLILVLATIHIVVNVLYTVVKREPLIPAMVTGEKPADDYADMAETTKGSWWIALACLAASAVLVFGAIIALGGKPFAY